MCQPLSHQLGIDHYITNSDIAEQSAIFIFIGDIFFQPDLLVFYQLAVNRQSFSAEGFQIRVSLWRVNTDIPDPVTTFDGNGITVNHLNDPGGIRWRATTEQE